MSLLSTGASSTSKSISHSSSELSSGGKIAVGVCVPVGVLILGAICFIIWHRRKKSHAQSASATRRIPELSGSDWQSELDPGARLVPGSTRIPLEISGAQRVEKDGIQRLELPGESVTGELEKDPKVDQ